jgi:hypothetical protein
MTTYSRRAAFDDSFPLTEPLPTGVANGRYGARLCENAQEPTRRRIVFSIALFPVAAIALFLFRLTKLRRTFYAQIECLCFHTASGMRTLSRGQGWAPAVGSVNGPSRGRAAMGETFPIPNLRALTPQRRGSTEAV